MERIGETVRRELGRYGTAGAMADTVALLARRGRRAGGRERLAGAIRPRRDAARLDQLVGVGLRARPARGRDPAAAARGSRQGRSEEASVRSRAPPGPPRAGLCEAPPGPSGADSGAGARGARAGGGDRLRRTSQISGKSCARKPRERRLRPLCLIDLVSARKCSTCRAFFMTKASYTAKDITVLEGLEPVRLRPGMYIGSTGARGLHQLAFELVDNAVDEALAGRADTISFTIHPDGSVTVSDNGSGIPVDTMADQGQSALTVVLTKLHAGGKFGGDGTPYKVSGGLHGVGVSVVNALSEWLTVEVHRDGKIYQQSFARGEPTGELEVAGKATGTGTTDHLLPRRRGDLRGRRLVVRDAQPAPARDGVPDQGAADRPHRRARRRRERRVPLRGRDPGLRHARQLERRTRSTSRSRTSRARASRARSRSRCSGTRRTRTRSTPSPTTSTPTRAARTSPASTPR